jgi:hypothetical protein
MKWPWSKKKGTAPSSLDAEHKFDAGTWQPPKPLVTRETPREILANDFKSLNGGLPIQGGWGYTKEDPCIICKDDPLNEPGAPFDGTGIEYVFVEKRCYEELIIFCPKGEAHSGIKWKLQKQMLVGGENGRNYDHLVFEITCFREQDWEMLKAEHEQGQGDPDFDMDAHWSKHESLKQRYIRDYWFDITSFFGK